MFPILTHDQLLAKIDAFDAIKYSKTRNYLTGGVSQLSPYITHGVITTKEIVQHSLRKYSVYEAEMRYKELLRREYFVQVQRWKGDAIFEDMEQDKTGCSKQVLLPASLLAGTTPSAWVNAIVGKLHSTGYLHNHERMRLAAYCCHRWNLYRKALADRTYYYFLDGELACNHLSWQRVASTFSHKPYFMNEENLIRYAGYTDPIFSWTYQEIEKKLFDPKRQSPFAHDEDVVSTLQTDFSVLPHITSSDISTMRTLLTPWDLHPQKIKDPATTCCVLDILFLTKFPWSTTRITFISEYCALYGIKLAFGDVADILQHIPDVVVYETRNPVYREAFERYASNKVPHEWTSPVATQTYTKKFFPFWEKTVKHL